ncbi:VirB4 family type IV secretion system protein, partial [Lactococcus lactis]
MENASSNKMVKFYNDTIKNKRAELLKTYDPLKKKEIQNQIDKADMQLENYIQNRSTFITQYTYIYLQEESKEALDNLTDSVTGTLIKLQLKYMTPTKAMIQAFWSSLPLQENLLEEYTYKQSNTETA